MYAQKKESLTLKVESTEFFHSQRENIDEIIRSTELDAQKIYELTGIPLPVSFSLIETKTANFSFNALQNNFNLHESVIFETDLVNRIFTEKKSDFFIDASDLCSYHFFKTEGPGNVETIFTTFQQLLTTMGWKITEKIFFNQGIIVAKKNKTKAFCTLKQNNTKKITSLAIITQTT